MEKILITGGKGLVGVELSKKLLAEGYEVFILSRSRSVNPELKSFFWDFENKKIDKGALDHVDYIIHLAGENISEGRWTKKRRQQIIDSRIKSAEFLYNKLKENQQKLKGFFSASAIGYYGTETSEEIFYETNLASSDFLGQVCKEWEISSNKFKEIAERVAVFRIGVVLSHKGGAFPKMTKYIDKHKFISILGSGNQYMPWIHISDLANIFLKAIRETKIEGVYNAVAPQHITNKEFNTTLKEVANVPKLKIL